MRFRKSLLFLYLLIFQELCNARLEIVNSSVRFKETRVSSKSSPKKAFSLVFSSTFDQAIYLDTVPITTFLASSESTFIADVAWLQCTNEIYDASTHVRSVMLSPMFHGNGTFKSHLNLLKKVVMAQDGDITLANTFYLVLIAEHAQHLPHNCQVHFSSSYPMIVNAKNEPPPSVVEISRNQVRHHDTSLALTTFKPPDPIDSIFAVFLALEEQEHVETGIIFDLLVDPIANMVIPILVSIAVDVILPIILPLISSFLAKLFGSVIGKMAKNVLQPNPRRVKEIQRTYAGTPPSHYLGAEGMPQTFTGRNPFVFETSSSDFPTNEEIFSVPGSEAIGPATNTDADHPEGNQSAFKIPKEMTEFEKHLEDHEKAVERLKNIGGQYSGISSIKELDFAVEHLTSESKTKYSMNNETIGIRLPTKRVWQFFDIDSSDSLSYSELSDFLLSPLKNSTLFHNEVERPIDSLQLIANLFTLESIPSNVRPELQKIQQCVLQKASGSAQDLIDMLDADRNGVLDFGEIRRSPFTLEGKAIRLFKTCSNHFLKGTYGGSFQVYHLFDNNVEGFVTFLEAKRAIDSMWSNALDNSSSIAEEVLLCFNAAVQNGTLAQNLFQAANAKHSLSMSDFLLVWQKFGNMILKQLNSCRSFHAEPIRTTKSPYEEETLGVAKSKTSNWIQYDIDGDGSVEIIDIIKAMRMMIDTWKFTRRDSVSQRSAKWAHNQVNDTAKSVIREYSSDDDVVTEVEFMAQEEDLVCKATSTLLFQNELWFLLDLALDNSVLSIDIERVILHMLLNEPLIDGHYIRKKELADERIHKDASRLYNYYDINTRIGVQYSEFQRNPFLIPYVENEIYVWLLGLDQDKVLTVDTSEDSKLVLQSIVIAPHLHQRAVYKETDESLWSLVRCTSLRDVYEIETDYKNSKSNLADLLWDIYVNRVHLDGKQYLSRTDVYQIMNGIVHIWETITISDSQIIGIVMEELNETLPLETDSILSLLDQNQDTVISKSEFLHDPFLILNTTLTRISTSVLWHLLDENRDSYITVPEFIHGTAKALITQDERISSSGVIPVLNSMFRVIFKHMLEIRFDHCCVDSRVLTEQQFFTHPLRMHISVLLPTWSDLSRNLMAHSDIEKHLSLEDELGNVWLWNTSDDMTKIEQVRQALHPVFTKSNSPPLDELIKISFKNLGLLLHPSALRILKSFNTKNVKSIDELAEFCFSLSLWTSFLPESKDNFTWLDAFQIFSIFTTAHQSFLIAQNDVSQGVYLAVPDTCAYTQAAEIGHSILNAPKRIDKLLSMSSDIRTALQSINFGCFSTKHHLYPFKHSIDHTTWDWDMPGHSNPQLIGSILEPSGKKALMDHVNALWTLYDVNESDTITVDEVIASISAMLLAWRTQSQFSRSEMVYEASMENVANISRYILNKMDKGYAKGIQYPEFLHDPFLILNASRFLTYENEMWFRLDSQADGTVTHEELSNVLNDMLFYSPLRSKSMQTFTCIKQQIPLLSYSLMQSYDINGDAGIQQNEYNKDPFTIRRSVLALVFDCHFMNPLSISENNPSSDAALISWTVLDPQGKGYFEIDVMQTLFQVLLRVAERMQYSSSDFRGLSKCIRSGIPKTAQSAFNSVDLDNDLKISKEEFSRFGVIDRIMGYGKKLLEHCQKEFNSDMSKYETNPDEERLGAVWSSFLETRSYIDDELGPAVEMTATAVVDSGADMLVAAMTLGLTASLSAATMLRLSTDAFYSLTTMLTASLTDTMTNEILNVVTNPTVNLTNEMLAHSMTPALTQGISSVVVDAMSNDPIDAYYCYFCDKQKAYCDLCEKSKIKEQMEQHYTLYYARYYGKYYGDAYALYYL